MMSRSIMLLTYGGRRSGKEYTTLVNYVRDGDRLITIASREHTWWKNFRGGAPVVVRVRGRNLRGIAEALEGGAAMEGLLEVLRVVPAYRNHWGVRLDANGRPEDPEVLVSHARTPWLG